jgi:hypothetical protein
MEALEALNATIVKNSSAYPYYIWETLDEARDLPQECFEKLRQIDQAYQVVFDAGDPEKELRRVYKKYALQFHPDKGGDRHILQFVTALKDAYTHEHHGQSIRNKILKRRRERAEERAEMEAFKQSAREESNARKEEEEKERRIARERDAFRQAFEEREAREAAKMAAEREEAIKSAMNSLKPAKSVHWTMKEQKQLISAIAKHGWPKDYDAFNPSIDQWEDDPRLGDDNDWPWSRIKEVMPEKFAKGDTCRNRYSRMIQRFCKDATGDPSDFFTLQIFCTLAREQYDFGNAYLKYKVMSCTRHIDSKKINVKWQSPSYIDDIAYDEHKEAVAAFERCSWNTNYLKVHWKTTEEDLEQMWKAERNGQWYGFKQAYVNMRKLEGASDEEAKEDARKAAEEAKAVEEAKVARKEEARKALLPPAALSLRGELRHQESSLGLYWLVPDRKAYGQSVWKHESEDRWIAFAYGNWLVQSGDSVGVKAEGYLLLTDKAAAYPHLSSVVWQEGDGKDWHDAPNARCVCLSAKKAAKAEEKARKAKEAEEKARKVSSGSGNSRDDVVREESMNTVLSQEAEVEEAKAKEANEALEDEESVIDDMDATLEDEESVIDDMDATMHDVASTKACKSVEEEARPLENDKKMKNERKKISPYLPPGMKEDEYAEQHGCEHQLAARRKRKNEEQLTLHRNMRLRTIDNLEGAFEQWFWKEDGSEYRSMTDYYNATTSFQKLLGKSSEEIILFLLHASNDDIENEFLRNGWVYSTSGTTKLTRVQKVAKTFQKWYATAAT